MRRTMFALAGLVAVAPFMTTCGDSLTGPRGGEVVALARVGDQPLPATLEEAPGYFRTFLADTIRLGANGLWSRRQIQDFSTPTEETRRLDWSSDGTIERRDGQVVLDFVCNDTASCIAPARLTPDTDGYRVERQVAVDSVLVFRYRTVGEGGS